MQGETRSVIKLRVSNSELQGALGGRHIAQPASPSATVAETPSTSSSPASTLHPTVASYSRSDVLSADTDTLRTLADAGHPFAQHYIGVLLMTGSEGVPLDRSRAMHYLHLSIQHSQQQHVEPLSHFFLAGLIDEQTKDDTAQQSAPLPSDLPSTLSLYQRYCDMSDPSAPFFSESLFRAAREMLSSDRVVSDEWMERAARGGHAEAMLHVARQRLDNASKRDATDEVGRQAAVRDEQEAQEWMHKAKQVLEQQLATEGRSTQSNATQSFSQQPSNRTTAGTVTPTIKPSRKKKRRR